MTRYIIATNGVDQEATYTAKARAIGEAEKIRQAADSRAHGDVITVRTERTGKVVWEHTAPVATVTVQGEEPSEWAPEFDRPEASECYFGCGVKPVAVFVDPVGVTNGLCASHASRVEGEGVKVHTIPVPAAQTDADSLSGAVEMVRAIQNGAVMVAGVIQDRPGNVGVTHYHAAACADVAREMKRWGQSESDVIRFPFSSVAEIIEFEFSDVENGNWADMMSHATDAIRIMPCLSSLPAGRTDNGPLVTQGGLFREGFDRPNLCTWTNGEKHCEAGEYLGEFDGKSLYGSVVLPEGKSMCDFHSDEMNQDTAGFPNVPDKGSAYDRGLTLAEVMEAGKEDDTDAGFVETLVTKEYHLFICVDERTGASVDLGWHTFTLNAAQSNDHVVIAEKYGETNGTGKPRHGWASIITVLEVCDI